ncbi:MAG: ABC transporter substrate-binding protein [Sporichthyaceae bacterium]
MRTNAVLGSWVVLAAVLLAACGGDGDSAVDSAPGGLLTGPGVSADTIALGVLTDNSGPFKNLGVNLRAGQELWVRDINAAGGICDRQIALEVRDHGYKAEQAKVLFPELEPKVAGVIEILGSAVVSTLKSDIADSQLTSTAIAWSSFLLDQPYLVVAGTTYDVEIINGLSYLLDEGLIKAGDTIADIYIDGDGGLNGLLGAQYMAREHDLKIVEKKLTATDADLTNVVTGLRGENVDAIVMTTTPSQTASVASASAALGLQVPIVVNSPSFDPVILDGPAAEALDNLYVVASAVPYSADVPQAVTIAKAYEAANTGRPSYAVQYGYALGLMWQQILERACAANDLSRAGIFAAKNASTTIDTKGLIAALDFSTPGAPSTREVYIARVDPSAAGGLRPQGPLFVSADAKAYQAPHQK